MQLHTRLKQDVQVVNLPGSQWKTSGSLGYHQHQLTPEPVERRDRALQNLSGVRRVQVTMTAHFELSQKQKVTTDSNLPSFNLSA